MHKNSNCQLYTINCQLLQPYRPFPEIKSTAAVVKLSLGFQLAEFVPHFENNFGTNVQRMVRGENLFASNPEIFSREARYASGSVEG